MKISLTVELTEKELAAALLPNGGKITAVMVDAPKTRAKRAPSATTQKGPAAAGKKTTPKKKVQTAKTTT